MGPEAGAVLQGTVPALGGWGGLVAFALMFVRTALALAVFSHGLARRPRSALRTVVVGLAFAVAMVPLLWLSVTLEEASGALAGGLTMLATFSVLLAGCVAVLLSLLDVSLWTALFCATAGYTMQNFDTGATELVGSLLRSRGVDPAAPVVYFLNELVCLVVVYGLCYLLMARRIDREGLVRMESHQMLGMMPVVSIAIIGLDVLIKEIEQSGAALGFVVLLRLFHGLACVATLWTEYQMLFRMRLEFERASAERLLAERERQYELTLGNIEAINIKCHDIRHQIRSLAEGGAVVDGAVLADIEREVSIYDSAVKTGNDALDTILTEKSLLCEQREIRLTCIADGAALGFMAPADLYALFGNALDNAIEAVGALDDASRRSISLVVRRTLGNVSIHVENFCEGERRFSADGLPETTKADRATHGFGTRSMRQIAERYGGTFSAELSEGTYRVDIMVPEA